MTDQRARDMLAVGNDRSSMQARKPAPRASMRAPNFGVVAMVLLVLAAVVLGIALPKADLTFGFDYRSVQLTGP